MESLTVDQAMVALTQSGAEPLLTLEVTGASSNQTPADAEGVYYAYITVKDSIEISLPSEPPPGSEGQLDRQVSVKNFADFMLLSRDPYAPSDAPNTANIDVRCLPSLCFVPGASRCVASLEGEHWVLHLRNLCPAGDNPQWISAKATFRHRNDITRAVTRIGST
jgi:hypothetical protein